MKNPVIAIGLDAAEPSLVEKWMADGHLPNLQRLRDQGAYTRLNNFEYYRAETPWTTFLTGASPHNTGYWSPVKFHQADYSAEEIGAYDFQEHPPFYALKDGHRVAVFDMPQAPLSDTVNGIQVLAWGAHSPMTPSHSLPANLLQDIIEQHGEHPTLREDHASTLDVAALDELRQKLEVGIDRRAKICQDLLQREPWDLLLTIFGETHSAGHYFWHLSQEDHPLYPVVGGKLAQDPLLSVFKAVDRAVGDIISAAPANAHILVFAAHGMGSNVMDLPSMFFLPEFLYRWNFPGEYGLAYRADGQVPAAPMAGARAKRGWLGTMWSLKHETNSLKGFLRQKLPTKVFNKLAPLFGKARGKELLSPFQLQAEGDPLYFQPALWYKPFWTQMKAFALPSFSEGYIRINLKGREPQGVVDPAEYDAVCDEIVQKLRQMKDARTGTPMVKDIIRTRQSALDSDPKLPDADLVVIWQEAYTTDTVTSSEFGQIGPVPYLRTGSHRSEGFLVASGPAVQAGASLPTGHALDLAPTILSLMEAPIPAQYEGKPLVNVPVLSS